MKGKDTREGHRERLRERFLKSGLDGFHDYEIVELLLTLATPRKDCKTAAKDLLKKFNSLREVLEADPEGLLQVKGVGPKNVFGLKLARSVAERLLKEKVVKGKKLKTSQEVYDYLKVSMQDLKKEVFKVVFLDAQNQVLAMEDMFEGTVDASSLYPREIIKKAISLQAAGIICVHNHPTGNPAPSENDKYVTRHLVSAGQLLQISLVDHIIIGNDKRFSFADQGLIKEYERRMLNAER